MARAFIARTRGADPCQEAKPQNEGWRMRRSKLARRRLMTVRRRLFGQGRAEPAKRLYFFDIK